VKILLDTECWLWWLAAPERLNARALDIFETRRHALYLSAASSWEMAIKVALGKLRLPAPLPRYVPERLAEDGIEGLAVSHAHALAVAELPPLHADPFGRLLVAQARIERSTLMTADRALPAYDVPTLWAARDPSPRSRRRRSR
jgi:PIN domain nuclease of toxin-antitoxin system